MGSSLLVAKTSLMVSPAEANQAGFAYTLICKFVLFEKSTHLTRKSDHKFDNAPRNPDFVPWR